MERPILVNGEKLGERVDKGKRRIEKDEEKIEKKYLIIKEKIKSSLSKISREEIKDKVYLDEIVVAVRMEEGSKAKSYKPQEIEKRYGNEFIGAREYNLNEKKSKLYFLKTTFEKIADLSKDIDINSRDKFKEDIIKIENIDFLKPEEKILGFDDEWEYGKVEIVLHQLKNKSSEMLEKIKKILEINSIKIKEYENGPIFISALANKKNIKELSEVNFVRVLHPLRTIEILENNSQEYKEINSEVNFNKNNLTTIGIFDGGVDCEHEFLKGYVEEEDYSSGKDTDKYIKHGTAVAGALLYGCLSRKEIEEPKLRIKSFKVFPMQDEYDFDLYEVIDIIEKVIPKEKNIKVYNLSFGPQGEILDDHISRFTYAIDKLAFQYDVLFITAVGNDGGRIQSPSDTVNGIGVGAFSYKNNEKEITAYSCRGKGREGSKVKPDLLAFGGDNKKPFYVLRPFLSKGAYKDSGTSYSAPLVSKVAGEMLSVAPTLTSQLIKNLLILNADLKRNDFIGHGFLNENIKEMLNCNKKNEITVVYQGEFQAGKALKLEIPYVDLKNYQGNVNVEFCLTTITSINPFDTDGYTNTGIEVFFYPHSKKFKMKKRKIGEKNPDYTGVLNLLNENDKKKFEEYITEGYELKARPESRSTKKEKSEKLANSEDKKRAVKEIWDTVIKSSIGNMKMSSLYEPFIVLEGIGREGHDREFIKYALTVKIKLLKEYKGDLYTEIKNKYKMLSSLNIRQNLENRYKV